MTNARLVHIGNTRSGRKLFFRLEKERQKLLSQGFDATPKLLAAKLDVPEADVIEVSAHLASPEVSFEPRPDAEGVSLEEKLAGDEATPETNAAREEIADVVRTLSRAFEADLSDAREKAIWVEHLSAVEDPVSLSELGHRYGVSKQRMGQIATRLKARFRIKVEQALGEDVQMAWQPPND